MKPRYARTSPRSRQGFTLAETAVTIAVVAIVLTLTLQALEVAKLSAAHTMYRKVAWQLGIEMLGEIEAGRWQDELDSGASGTFAERDQPEYYWEVVLGDEAFPDVPEIDLNDPNRPFDTWRSRDEWRSQNTDDNEEDSVEPYEKVKLRIRFPKLRDFSNEFILERWVRWPQIYGEEEEEGEVPVTPDPNAGGGAANPGGGSPPPDTGGK